MKGSILVIDDEQPMLEACNETLAHYGYDVSICAAAAEGLDRARDRAFDVILLDLKNVSLFCTIVTLESALRHEL